MKYPLQIELENDMKESFMLFQKASFDYNDVKLLNQLTKDLARSYYNAIQRINDICVNRKRF